MDTQLDMDDATDSGCPVMARSTSGAALEAGRELVFPNYKRVFQQVLTDSSGLTELHLWVDDKEIVFDEPELFSFGEHLVKQRSFIAGTAVNWGEGYSWPRIRELLEQLMDEGILFHGNAIEADADAGHNGSCRVILPAAESRVPRTWFECEAITRELTGRPIDLSYLELVIPIFRVAHIVLDAEGRQVGEANVFPKALRIEVPTDWRACLHAGSRYQSDQPMNVSALKAMRRHWPQMMKVLTIIREAYLARFPKARAGWTVGDLERLSSLVLAIPAYLVMQTRQPVPNGQLHPVLSCLFRVTDGLRITMHQMLFLPTRESTLRPDTPMTSPEIYAYAERNHVFFSDYGVCAGPRSMIEEFLRVLVDGQAPDGAESVQLNREVGAALDDLENAFDYGLYGLQAYAVVFSLWPAMARAYECLWSVLENWTDERAETFRAFRDRFERDIDFLRTRSLLVTEEWRESREAVYADMYERCAEGLGNRATANTLAKRIAPERSENTKRATDRLRGILSQRFFGVCAADSPDLENFMRVLMEYLGLEQAIVRAACSTQGSINRLLGRTEPTRPFQASDIDLFNQLQGDVERVPYLAREIEDALGMKIVVTRNGIEITDRITA